MQETKLMLKVESRGNRGNIEEWLPAMAGELGYPEAARQLGINKATVERWSLWMGFRFQKGVVPVGGRRDAVTVEETGGD